MTAYLYISTIVFGILFNDAGLLIKAPVGTRWF